MNPDLRKDLQKARSDGYKQLLLKQDRNNISAYEKRLDVAYTELESIVQPEVYKRIVSISDQLLRAVIGYTFECFADMMAELDIKKEEKSEDDF
mgnify:CR=1 FL=1